MSVSLATSPETPAILFCSLSGTDIRVPDYGYSQTFTNIESVIDAWRAYQGVVCLHSVRQTRELDMRVAKLARTIPDAVIVVMLDLLPESPSALIELGAQEVVTAGSDLFTVIEVARARKNREFELQHYLYFDGLTQLANRQLFQDRMEHSLAQHKRSRADLALMILDLNRFKRVNDEHGHLQGDALLQAVADRLRGCTRSSDTLARIGSNTFAVIAGNLGGRSVASVAEKLMDQFRQPFTLDCGDVFVTASMGIELGSAVTYDAVQIIRRAELALHEAKRRGGNHYCINDQPRPADRIRLSLEGSLYQALERGEIYLEYQPQVSIDGRQFLGVEALMRWTHPELGGVSPAIFIPVLEETGLIEDYGIWCLEQACSQFRQWLEAGQVTASSRVSVNLSARQFRQENLAGCILDVLDATGLSPTNLTLEITKTMLMQNHGQAVTVLSELREAGVAIAVDDFGTGFSSLVYLKTLPIDYLKIDKAFIRDISSSRDDEAIASLIIDLAHNLNLNVVAEGVESQEALTMLGQLGCDQYQGFFFARPVAPDQIPALVARCH